VYRTLITLILLAAATLAGCQRSPGPAVAATEPDPSVQVYDVGDILAGQDISRSFSFTNRTDQTLKIASPTDIRVGCGCTGVTLAATTLAPGASTDVFLRVHTSRMKGPFQYASTITWTADDGSTVPFAITLMGTAAPLLVAAPDSLSFGKADVLAGTTKEITVTAPAGCRMSGWAARTDHASFRVLAVEPIDDRTAKVRVSCTVPTEVEVVSGLLRVTATVAGCDRKLEVTEAEVQCVVQAWREIDFTVTPAQLPVQVDAATNGGKGSVLLRGKRIEATDSPVTAVTCDGVKVAWKVSKSKGSAMAVLAMEFPGLGAMIPPPAEVVIEVAGVGPVKIPLLVSRAAK
jgi:hypothetical protein